jgi:putative PIN family toxin of toxin-antitoxin system
VDESYFTPPIVMDTNVLVAGACRHESSFAYRVLTGVLRSEIPLMMTPAIALEYLDVLQRPRILALTELSHAQAADLVADLIAISRRVQLHFNWRPNLRDESDNKFVEAAIHAAAIIVTYNESHYRYPDLPRLGWRALSPQEFVTRYL